jgi:hypothetical protein
MNVFKVLARSFTGTRWLKSYVVYLAVTLLFLVPACLLIHVNAVRGAVAGAIVFAGLMIKDPIQRRIWP